MGNLWLFLLPTACHQAREEEGLRVPGALQSSTRRREAPPTWSCSSHTHSLSRPMHKALLSSPRLAHSYPRETKTAEGSKVSTSPPLGWFPFQGPQRLPCPSPRPAITPAQPLTSPWPRPLPCLLLAARLGALGSAGVVPQHSSEAQGHPHVTAVHTHHGHLLLGRALGEPCLAQQWLQTEKGREGKQWARSPLGSWARHEDPAHTDSPLRTHMHTHDSHDS